MVEEKDIDEDSFPKLRSFNLSLSCTISLQVEDLSIQRFYRINGHWYHEDSNGGDCGLSNKLNEIYNREKVAILTEELNKE